LLVRRTFGLASAEPATVVVAPAAAVATLVAMRTTGPGVAP
jgi:hypothetical protein